MFTILSPTKDKIPAHSFYFLFLFFPFFSFPFSFSFFFSFFLSSSGQTSNSSLATMAAPTATSLLVIGIHQNNTPESIFWVESVSGLVYF
ncbi:unnamed protein product [Coffea canephora]|uniref:DH200=94 genomic scaffold, scaffold_1068 n=1 Tax=Coffea canephora TaxID=49390 RepID=A0A068VI47_COFCA|nr:unnamed protein product [Coffea canephora]